MLQTSLVLNMANILCEHWIAGARATDGCSVIFKWKLKAAFPNTNSDLTDCNLSGSNCTLENSMMTLKSHMQSGKSVFTSSNSWGPEVQPAIKLHDVLLSAFEAWENLPFLHKPLWLKTSQHPPFRQWKGLRGPSVICFGQNQPGLSVNGVEKVNLVYFSWS